MSGICVRVGIATFALTMSPLFAKTPIKKPPPVITPGPPPIVQVQTVTPPSETYGQWIVEKVADGYTASTQNASKSFFGIFCSTTCSIIFLPEIGCEEGHVNPALISMPAGAAAMNFRCVKIGKINLLAAPLEEKVVNAMEIGGELGVAFPLRSGQFQVSRFSLTGGLTAAKRAYQLAQPQGGSDDAAGLRDLKL